MIADYFIVRRRRLNVDDLYRRGGEYEYRNGVNPRGVVSLARGHCVALIGSGGPGAAVAVRLRLVCGIRCFRRSLRGDDGALNTRSSRRQISFRNPFNLLPVQIGPLGYGLISH